MVVTPSRSVRPSDQPRSLLPLPISESAAPGNLDKAPIGRCPTPARPSAPEGVAPGRALMLAGESPCRSRLSRVPPPSRDAGSRVPVASDPSLRRQRGLRVSRRDGASRFRASRAHRHSALVPPWTTPGGPPGRGSGSRVGRIQEVASAKWRATAPTAVACPFRCWMRAERRLTCRCGRTWRWRQMGPRRFDEGPLEVAVDVPRSWP